MSTLTKVLRDSFIGEKSRTCMVCACWLCLPSNVFMVWLHYCVWCRCTTNEYNLWCEDVQYVCLSTECMYTYFPLLFHRLPWCLQAWLHVNTQWTHCVTLTGLYLWSLTWFYFLFLCVILIFFFFKWKEYQAREDKTLNIFCSLAEWKNWMAIPLPVEQLRHKSL